MCFSAGASFGASAVLAAIGVVAIIKAKNTPQRLFAAIPLLFSLQQFSEGMLWISLLHTGWERGQVFYTYTFLAFAMMIWPIWIPLTIRLLENDEKKKRVINILLGIGLMVSFSVAIALISYKVDVSSADHHLHYMVDFPVSVKNFMWIFNLLYITATIISTFISTHKRMKWLGIIFLAAYLFALIFYNGFVVSVWCYFAALLSVAILWILPATTATTTSTAAAASSTR